MKFDVQYVENLMSNSMYCIEGVQYDIEFDIKFSVFCTSNFRSYVFSVITVCDHLILGLVLTIFNPQKLLK